jgi:hypothetical protein
MRDQILDEIKRLAATDGGQPPGVRSFERKTGISQSAWRGRFWSKWSDAVAEAGFAANTSPERVPEDTYLAQIANLIKLLGKVPTVMEMRIRAREQRDCPNPRSLLRKFGSNEKMLQRVSEWVKNKDGFASVAVLLSEKVQQNEIISANTKDGLVYLIKSGAHHKVGRSDELERRVKEIRIALPEAATLVHSIRTDDPAGIEAYWHRRFADRRANGEWFKLTSADVAAFKRRKYQ